MFLIDAVGMVSILAVWTFTDKDKFDISKRQFIESAFYYAGIIEGIYRIYGYKLLSRLIFNYFIFFVFSYFSILDLFSLFVL